MRLWRPRDDVEPGAGGLGEGGGPVGGQLAADGGDADDDGAGAGGIGGGGVEIGQAEIDRARGQPPLAGDVIGDPVAQAAGGFRSQQVVDITDEQQIGLFEDGQRQFRLGVHLPIPCTPGLRRQR